MGGKSGGGQFVERGTPLSQQQVAARDNAVKAEQRRKDEERMLNHNDGNAGNMGGWSPSGGEVDASTAAAIGAGMIGGFVGAVTGGLPGAISLGYSAYTSMEDGVLGQVTGYGKQDPNKTENKGFFSGPSNPFGSLLDDDDEGSDSGAASSGTDGGYGNPDAGGMGMI